jgi:hypothetical protein
MRAMPIEPPSNGQYLLAAYLIGGVILLGYFLSLWLKSRKI